MLNYSDIRTVHLEISTRCNAACPFCPRNASGTDADLDYPVHDLSLSEIKQMFTVPFVKQLKGIHFGGNFGDFVTARDGLEIVKYFITTNPKLHISIHTNGSARATSWWEELGSIPNIVVGFDLDGLEDTHGLYRRNTDWHTIIKNAKAFISAGGRADWRFIHFDHNGHQIDSCKQMAKELGFKKFEILYHGRTNGPVYHTKTGQYEYTIGNMGRLPQHAMEFHNIKTKISSPEHRIEFYKTAPVRSIKNCKAKVKNEIYITATGEVYPCCYLGHYPSIREYTQWWQEDNFQLYPMIKDNNALEHGIEKAMSWSSAVEESWSKPSYTEGRLYKCDTFCGENSPIQNKITGL
jgi:MoaA/NifB/PqqE/SkfB family radical SAM enzyme